VNIKQWVDKHYINKGLTQTDAALALGLLQSTLNQYMNLKRFPVNKETISKLESRCKGLDIAQWHHDFLVNKQQEAAA
jgi:transcriptional regulator with XRE-family HTH domain